MISGWHDHSQEILDLLNKLDYRVKKVFSLIGVILAIVMSWQYNHSVLWAVLHGCFGWLYVLYAWIFK